MRTANHILGILLLLPAVPAAAQVIAVHRNGETYFHYDVNQFEALIETTSPNHTLPGDTILLPGGTITTPILLVDKPLTFIGAGMLASSTPVTTPSVLAGNTVPNNNLVLQAGAAGTSFHGIRFDRVVAFNGNVNTSSFSSRFLQCYFEDEVSLSTTTISSNSPYNVSIEQCVINNDISASDNPGPENLSITNSHVRGALWFVYPSSNCSFSQNIIYANSLSNYGYPYTGFTFTNNILLRAGTSPIGFGSVQGASFYNNLFSTTAGNNPAYTFGPNVGANVGNLSAPVIANIFENVTSYSSYVEAFDYHLKAGSPALGAGLSGYDLGVYGGPPGTAWKEVPVPFNPHWVQLPPLGVDSGGVVVFPAFKASAQQDLGPAQLVGVRYWVGQPASAADPGVRFKAFDVPQAEIDLPGLALDVCGFPAGSQVLKLQLLDNAGRWSSVVTRSMTVIAAGAPNAVQAITPSGPLCPGSTVTFTATHTVVAPSGTPTSFAWSVPPGYAIAGGQGTPSASITIGTDPGMITVTASNACGDVAADFPVMPIQPFQLNSISGPLGVCFEDTATYSTQVFNGTYQWTAPNGWAFVPPNPSGPTVTIVPDTGAVQGPIEVQVLNACGDPSNVVSFTVTPATPIILSGIWGATTVCTGEPTVFTTDLVNGTYQWTAPPGWIFDPPNPTGHTVTLTPGPNAQPGPITTSVTTACASNVVSESISAVVPFVLTALTGTDTVCDGSSTTLTISPAVNGTHFWTPPVGWAFDPPNPSGSTATLVPDTNATAGEVTVAAVNSCGDLSNVLTLQLVPVDAVALTAITGPAVVCANTGAIYTTDAAPGTYQWDAPQGWSFVPPSPSGPIATLVPDTNAVVGDITVSVYNGCPGDTAILTVTPDVAALISSITGTLATGQNGTAEVTLTAPDADSLAWILPAGWLWNEVGSDTLDATAYLVAPADTGSFSICAVSYSAGGCTDTACWAVQVDLNVAVQQADEVDAIGVQPNPTSGPFALVFGSTGPWELTVHDVLGRALHNSRSTHHRVLVDPSGWPAGCYLVHATGPAGRHARARVVIQQ